MACCSVRWCGKNSRTSSNKTDGITFHRFPKEPVLREKWIFSTKRENWLPTDYSVVCSRHFTEDCFYSTKNRRRLFDTAVPTLNLPLLGNTKNINLFPSSSFLLPISATQMTIKQETTHPEDPLHFNLPTKDPLCQSILLTPCIPVKTSVILSTSVKSEQISTTPKANTRKVDPETPLQFYSPSKKRLCRRILELQKKVAKKNKTIKVYRDKLRYYKNKVETLKVTINELEKKCPVKAEKRIFKRKLLCLVKKL